MRASHATSSRRRSESGFAMIMAVIIIAVMAALGALVLTNGSHADRSSGRGENWNQSLHVAEAGAEEAAARMTAVGSAVGSFTGSTEDGEYAVNVTPLGRNRYQIDAVGHVGTVASLEAERGVRIVYGPFPSFKYAIFSLSDVNTKNNNNVTGDVWANGSVTVYNNDTVTGSVNAATGFVRMNNGSTITKDVWTGGYNGDGAIYMDDYTTIGGSAKASSVTPGCTSDVPSNYAIYTTGTIVGTATTLAPVITGTQPLGGAITSTCTEAPVTKTIPSFTYNPLNYDPAPSEYSSVADFQAWVNANKLDFKGVHYVKGSGWIDLSQIVVTGDAAVIATEAAIYAADSGGGMADVPGDKVLVLASWFTPTGGSACTDQGGNPVAGASVSDIPCAIGVKNNFDVSNGTATLLYAPNGPCAFKNSPEFFGAMYCADIVLKNNMNVIYDSRVEQIVGFGVPELVVESWVERPASELTAALP